MVYTIDIHDIMRCLHRPVHSDQLSLESNIHNVHVDIDSVLIVSIRRPTFLIALLLGRARLLGVVHLELGLVSLLLGSNASFSHLLLSSAPVIQTADEASIVLVALPPVVHLGL